MMRNLLEPFQSFQWFQEKERKGRFPGRRETGSDPGRVTRKASDSFCVRGGRVFDGTKERPSAATVLQTYGRKEGAIPFGTGQAVSPDN